MVIINKTASEFKKMTTLCLDWNQNRGRKI